MAVVANAQPGKVERELEVGELGVGRIASQLIVLNVTADRKDAGPAGQECLGDGADVRFLISERYQPLVCRDDRDLLPVELGLGELREDRQRSLAAGQRD